MKTLLTIAAIAGALAILRTLSNRLASHQALVPEVSNRINTRVTRINQH
jgi:hypothetical protein